MHKIVNGQRVELTAEEITQREAEEVQWISATIKMYGIK